MGGQGYPPGKKMQQIELHHRYAKSESFSNRVRGFRIVFSAHIAEIREGVLNAEIWPKTQRAWKLITTGA